MHAAPDDAVSVFLGGGEVKLWALVESVEERGREASVAAKQQALQRLVNEMAAAELGRRPREPQRASQATRVSRWCCHRCGSHQASDFWYSGGYARRVVFSNGAAPVRLPRIRCRCGGSVPPDFGPVLRKRQRLWYDLRRDVIERYESGAGYRAVQAALRRRGVYVGLSSLPAMVAACRDVGLHAQPHQGRLLAAVADGAFWRVGGQLQAILHVVEVRPRAQPRTVGRHQLQFETGQVVASMVAAAESYEHWVQAFEDIYRHGWVTEKGELFLTSDGNEGLRTAAEVVFGFGVQQRCTWHIAHRARDWAPNDCAAALENAVHHVFNAATHDELHERLRQFAHRWRPRAPEAVASVLRKAPQALAYLVATDFPLRPKTAAIAERHNLEYKRRLRPTRGLHAQANLAALVRLIDLQHNCARRPGADWLHLVAADLWPQPIHLHHHTDRAPPPPRPIPTPTANTTATTTAYTTRGT